jgi:GGDEF domain-containing protein
MRQVTPAMDVIARIGGDEFIILADKMDPATAHQTGQRFIDTLSDTSFLLSGPQLRSAQALDFPQDRMRSRTFRP